MMGRRCYNPTPAAGVSRRFGSEKAASISSSLSFSVPLSLVSTMASPLGRGPAAPHWLGTASKERRADERRERKNKAVNKIEHAERRGARDRKQAAETRTCSITAKVAASRSRFFVTAHCS